MFKTLFSTLAFMTYASSSQAGVCDWLLGKFTRTSRPEVANAIEVGDLARARWRKITEGHATEFQSLWGRSLVFMGEKYLIISLRPGERSGVFDEEHLARLVADAGPIEQRTDVALQDIGSGTVVARQGCFTLYLGPVHEGDQTFVPRSARALRTLFQDLPYEIRRGRRNPKPAFSLVPSALANLDWRAVGQAWKHDLESAWGKTVISIDSSSARIFVQPRSGDYVFGPREREHLIARVPGVVYRLGSDFNFVMNMPTTTDRGHFELILERGDRESDVFAASVSDFVLAVLRDVPARVPRDILTGRRPAKMFDPQDEVSRRPMKAK